MYTVQNSEQNKEKSTEYETKSLLYLLAIHQEKDQIELFVIDFFNDLTGIDNNFNRLWDVQVKGRKDLNPKKIGQSLFTLVKNFTSEITFYQCILFMPKLKEGYLIDENKLTYGVDNFQVKFLKKITAGLIQENNRVDSTQKIAEDNSNLISFMNKVFFVVDSGDKSNYVRGLIDFKNKDSLGKELLISIFDEIRDKQESLKNKNVEGVQIRIPADSLKYNRHMNKNEILLLVMNRIIGGEDLFSNRTIPISFKDETNGLDEEDIRDLIMECNEKIAKAFFNKNNKKDFWKFFEKIISLVKENPAVAIRSLYSKLLDSGVKIIYPFEEKSTLYFLSQIKEGIENDS